MKNLLILTIAFVCCFAANCANKTGVPVEFSNACAVENEKKYLEVSGFLNSGGGVYCSNRGGRMECSFNFRETPDGEKKISAYIEQGSSANSVEELKKGFKPEDVKIRANDGSVINLADKVKVTGEMNVTPDGKVCFINVTKIEK